MPTYEVEHGGRIFEVDGPRPPTRGELQSMQTRGVFGASKPQPATPPPSMWEQLNAPRMVRADENPFGESSANVAEFAGEHPYITGGALALAGGGVGMARALTAKGMSAVARAWSVARAGGTSLVPTVKYEIAHQVLRTAGVPEVIAMPAAMAAASLGGKKPATPAPQQPPAQPTPQPAPAASAMDVSAMSRNVYTPPVAASPVPAPKPAPTPPPAPAPAPTPQPEPVAVAPARMPPQPPTPAPGTRGVNVSQEQWNKAVDALNARRLPSTTPVASPAVETPPASAPATPTPAAAPAVSQSAPTSRAGMSPQQIRNEVGIYARRAGLTKPGQPVPPEVEAEAMGLIQQGKTPAQAIAEIQIRTAPTPQQAPVAQADPTSAPNRPADADEALAYARMRTLGQSDAEAMAGLEQHRQLANIPGTVPVGEMRGRVSRRLARTNRTSEEQPSAQNTPPPAPAASVETPKPAPRPRRQKAKAESAPSTPEVYAYKGYTIKRNYLTGELHIEKDGHLISRPKTDAEARATIDQLTE